jgi:hypothetical protein
MSKSTPTSSLKKHLNILKNNGKKVLLGSHNNSNNNNNNNLNPNPNGSSSSTVFTNNKPQPLTKMTGNSGNSGTSSKSGNGGIKHQSPTSLVSTSPSLSTSPSTNIPFSKLQEYEMKITELKNEINTSYQSTNEYKHEIKDLQMEIERLSHLYNFELTKQTKYEEKMISLKQTAEEKQIESAAIKYEFRKVQELKDNLAAENAYLKSLINNNNNAQHSVQKLSVGSSLMTTSLNNNVSTSSSPKSTYNSPRTLNSNLNNVAISSTSSLCSAGSTSLINTSMNNLNANLQVQG